MSQVEVRSIESDKLKQEISAGTHHFVSDAPQSAGGVDAGPDPHELLLGALGACTAMTLQLYAKRKGWDLKAVNVKVTEVNESKQSTQFKREIEVSGALSAEQIETLKSIADKCPIHKILEGPKEIITSIASTKAHILS